MNKKGFTLIELLIVVVIIGILAAIAIPRFGETRERAFVSAMQSDLNQVRTAQEMWYQMPGNDFTYAADIGDLTGANIFSPTAAVEVNIDAADGTSWSATATHASTDQACTYDSDTGIIACAIP